MSRLSSVQRRCLAVSFIAAILLVIVILTFTVHWLGTSIQTTKANRLKPLVGTWRGDHGVMLDFRPNGTARSRSIEHPTSGISNFEWDFADGKLSVKMTARREEVGRRFRQFLFGVTTMHYDVTVISPTEFQMVETSEGTTLRFSLADDEAFEGAP